MMLHCDIVPLWALGERTKVRIAASLCWPESDFSKKLASGRLSDDDGVIAVVVTDDGQPVGWARSEPWKDDAGWGWHTLEAFVHPAYRRRGIAVFATAGLVVNVFAEEGYGCAVFSPPMLLVASKAGLHPSLFEKDRDGQWKPFRE